MTDVAVIGAGLSGLVSAILLAETGRKVEVVEHHAIPGGYLQQFFRKGTPFDVGFHYMGSTDPGHPMRQFLEHLQVWERLRLAPFPADAAIEVIAPGVRFGYPTRFARFREKAGAAWPHERAGVERFADAVDAMCAQFRWFDLKRDRAYRPPLDLGLPTGSFDDEIASYVTDPALREVLAYQSFNLGLLPHEIPWVKYCLALRSNFDETCRIVGGGGALVDALVARGRALGVRFHFKSTVVEIEADGRHVSALRTKNGLRIAAATFVAACHPKPILRCLSDTALKPLFKQRILDMKDSRGAFQVFLRLSEVPASIGARCLLLTDPRERAGEPPLDTILVTVPSEIDPPGRDAPRLEAMTYMTAEPFAAWAHTPIFRRGEAYEEAKRTLAERVIRMIAAVAPELPDKILDIYTATPLTAAHYTLGEGGSVFGISHDVTQQGLARPMPRGRLRNLFFTGHSVMMPGICGVFINAFDTCDMIRGDDRLFASVAT